MKSAAALIIFAICVFIALISTNVYVLDASIGPFMMSVTIMVRAILLMLTVIGVKLFARRIKTSSRRIGRWLYLIPIFVIIFFAELNAAPIYLVKARDLGTSMLPIIHEGQTSWSTAILDANLTGKIIIFGADNMMIQHRVLVDNGTFVLTKGDNNEVPDGWVPKSMVAYQTIRIGAWYEFFIDYALVVPCLMAFIYIWWISLPMRRLS